MQYEYVDYTRRFINEHYRNIDLVGLQNLCSILNCGIYKVYCGSKKYFGIDVQNELPIQNLTIISAVRRENKNFSESISKIRRNLSEISGEKKGFEKTIVLINKVFISKIQKIENLVGYLFYRYLFPINYEDNFTVYSFIYDFLYYGYCENYNYFFPSDNYYDLKISLKGLEISPTIFLKFSISDKNKIEPKILTYGKISFEILISKDFEKNNNFLFEFQKEIAKKFTEFIDKFNNEVSEFKNRYNLVSFFSDLEEDTEFLNFEQFKILGFIYDSNLVSSFFEISKKELKKIIQTELIEYEEFVKCNKIYLLKAQSVYLLSLIINNNRCKTLKRYMVSKCILADNLFFALNSK